MKLSAFLLLLCASLATAASPLRVLVSSDDATARTALTALLNERGAQAKEVPAVEAAQLATADVLVLDGAQSAAPREAVEAFAKRGGGIVVLGGGIGEGEWLKPLAGGAWTANSRKFANRLMLCALTDEHPITRNASPFDLDGETHYDLDLDPGIQVLASAFTPKVTTKRADSRAPEKLDRANVYDLQPQMWAFEGADQHRAFVLLQPSLTHASIRSFVRAASRGRRNARAWTSCAHPRISRRCVIRRAARAPRRTRQNPSRCNPASPRAPSRASR